MRGAGLSHVRATTCWEFFHRLLMFRLTSHWRTEERVGTVALTESTGSTRP